MMDIAAGIAYKKINGYSWYYVWQYGVNKRSIKTLYRTKSYKYHHDLFKNVTSKTKIGEERALPLSEGAFTMT